MADDDITFDGLNLVAADIDATAAFYALLGIAITIDADTIWRTDTGAHHLSGIDMGGTSDLDMDSPALARVYNAAYEANPAGNATILGFRLTSREAVDALHAKVVAAGHESRQAPFDAFWGARYAIVADPDGRAVGLMSPRDPARGSAPPAI